MVVAAIISMANAAGSHTEDILHWIEARALVRLSPVDSYAPCIALHCLTVRARQDTCMRGSF